MPVDKLLFGQNLFPPNYSNKRLGKFIALGGCFLYSIFFSSYFCNSSPAFYISTKSLRSKIWLFSSSHSQYQQLNWSPALALKDCFGGFALSCFGKSMIMMMMTTIMIWTYSQYSSLADTFAAVAIAVGTVDMLGITVALIMVLAFSAELKASTQFGVFHSLPHRDQGSSDEKDANM